MHSYVTDNAQLRQVHRAITASDPEFAKDAIATAATTPAHLPWLRVILRDLGRVLLPEIAKLLQDAIAEWDTPAPLSGVLGGEAASEPVTARRARTEPPAAHG